MTEKTHSLEIDFRNLSVEFGDRFQKFECRFYLLPPANEVWGKVIFSEACVKNSVRGGFPAYLAGHMTNQQGGLLLGVPALGGSAPRGCLLRGGACSGGAWWSPPSPRNGYCCGRYASYWNAFLFENVF